MNAFGQCRSLHPPSRDAILFAFRNAKSKVGLCSGESECAKIIRQQLLVATPGGPKVECAAPRRKWGLCAIIFRSFSARPRRRGGPGTSLRMSWI